MADDDDHHGDVRERRKQRELKRQRSHAGTLVVGERDAHSGVKGAPGARTMLQNLVVPDEMTQGNQLEFLHHGQIEMSEEKWNDNMKSVFATVDSAIEKYTNAILYYPTWEEAFLMRAEAYRTRSHLYNNAPGKEDSHTESLKVQKYMEGDLRRALSDVDHMLRFWNPLWISEDDKVRQANPIPRTCIIDAYPDQEMELQAEHRLIYAKAWLLRGCIRGDLYLVDNGVLPTKIEKIEEEDAKPDFVYDFESSAKLDTYDANVYVAWARAYWRIGAFQNAVDTQEEGIKKLAKKEAQANNRSRGELKMGITFLKKEKELLEMQWEAKKKAPAPGMCAIM